MENNNTKTENMTLEIKKGKVTINDTAIKQAIRLFNKQNRTNYSLTKEKNFEKRKWKDEHKNRKK